MSESNKDEAFRCLAIARRYKADGNLGWAPGALLPAVAVANFTPTVAAAKFCKKSISLYESKDAMLFLEELPDTPAPLTSPSEAMPRDDLPIPSTGEPHTPRGGSERLAVIQRIRTCRSTQYYEILGVPKDCTDSEIKRAYRKVRVRCLVSVLGTEHIHY